jgi:hypothetical protein
LVGTEGVRVLGEQMLSFVARGWRSNHRLPERLRAEVLELVRVHCPDFGSSLAHEKLTEVHGFRVPVDTLWGCIIETGL